jgi:uncharacterized protein (TIGR00369 family)
MSIWQTLPDPEDLGRALENTLAEHLDMRIEAWDDSSLTASMVVDRRTHQPMGLLHGGASVALAETSIAWVRKSMPTTCAASAPGG